MRFDEWLAGKPKWVERGLWWVFYVWLFTLVFVGAFVSGIYWTCDSNQGILLGHFQCVLKGCIHPYDIYECTPGMFMMHPKSEAGFDTYNLTLNYTQIQKS